MGYLLAFICLVVSFFASSEQKNILMILCGLLYIGGSVEILAVWVKRGTVQGQFEELMKRINNNKSKKE